MKCAGGATWADRNNLDELAGEPHPLGHVNGNGASAASKLGIGVGGHLTDRHRFLLIGFVLFVIEEQTTPCHKLVSLRDEVMGWIIVSGGGAALTTG